MESHLLPEEKIISRSENDQIVLTNYRIRHFTNNGKDVTSIMLDNIDVIEVEYRSMPWLIAVSPGCATAGFLIGNSITYITTGVIAAAVCILIYLLSRKNVISVVSGSGGIVFETKGMTSEKVLDFINDVEHARRNFIRDITYA